MARGNLNLVMSKHTLMQWNGPKLSKIVDSKYESLQCLHHAVIYDLEYALLLIGDRAGNIIIGILIKYDSVIKLAHKNL